MRCQLSSCIQQYLLFTISLSKGQIHADIHPQDNFRRIAESCGKETETYHQALIFIRQKCRTEGIDAALKDENNETLDALLLFDRKGVGQQLAAQAGKPFHLWTATIFALRSLEPFREFFLTSSSFSFESQNSQLCLDLSAACLMILSSSLLRSLIV